MNRHSRSIVLVGMMGAGKSSVGVCLRRRTGLKLFDTDEIVTLKLGMPISEIFSKQGEKKFREAETEVLRALATTEPVVIVTGGGIVLRASRAGSRPLLQCKNPKKAFTEMLRARLPLYAKIADIRVDTSVLTDEEVAVAILSKFSRYYRKSVPAATMPAIA
jgi:shikimate kinase